MQEFIQTYLNKLDVTAIIESIFNQITFSVIPVFTILYS